ncbi:alpha/beta fold hydrolase [Xylocopilactobacillus apis]|uniref:Esterase n=1 Tax=Xylocopilactobacillus apis TaxID=2932183 RepID=A0AAU9CPH6_9LACO|nr:alpha/beta hydrolase [Xylocopilactobacillus apis]BDR55852.1 esterase [Xylocopilactobacillus apis]
MTKINKDLVYDPIHDLKLDLYQNETSGKKQVSIILIHGGGWFRGSKDNETQLAAKLLEAGYNVIVPDYRLAPPSFYPAPLKDMNQVYNWIQDKFPESKIAAVGTSVGGTMAVELAIKYGIPAVSLSGIFDIEKWILKHHDVKAKLSSGKGETPEDQQKINESFYKGFIMNYLNNDEKLLEQATPYYRVKKTTGPVYLFNSLSELAPLSGVLKMEKSLIKKQVPTWVQFIPGTGHGGDYALSVVEDIANFIEKY